LIFFPEVWDDLGVAIRVEAMAARLQSRSELRVVEKFAVENDVDTAVLVGDRLFAVSDADNAQASGGQRNTRSIQEPVLVGAAMKEGWSHGARRSRRRRSLTGQVQKPRNAAHSAPPCRARSALLVERRAVLPGGHCAETKDSLAGMVRGDVYSGPHQNLKGGFRKSGRLIRRACAASHGAAVYQQRPRRNLQRSRARGEPGKVPPRRGACRSASG